MPPFRRMGRPGLIGMAARTAVVAGTATAVHGRMTAKQQEKAAQAADAQAYRDQQAAAPAPPPAAPAPPQPAPAAPAADAGTDVVAQLGQLAQLHSAGALSDAEFEAAKAKLLG